MKLSVIIPTCNRPATLARAVQSVLAQGIDLLEIVVVDDSADDATRSAMTTYVNRGQIRYFKNQIERSGPAFSRNFGVRVATGAFIVFLDDDDIYLQGRLANMLAVADRGGYVFVSTGRIYESNDFRTVRNVPRQCFGVITLDRVQFANDIDIGFMMDRKLFLELGGFDTSFKNLEDWDFVLRMLMVGNGYKLERLDYAVNVDPSRPRVSTDDYIGYLQLAEKHQLVFGDRWRVFMSAMSARLKGNLNFLNAISLSISGRTLAPLTIFVKSRLVMLKGMYELYRRWSDPV